MSAGPYIQTKYETRISWVVTGRVQPETIELSINGIANAPPALNVYAGLPSAIMRGPRRSIGIHSRQLRLTLSDGEFPPPGYSGRGVVVPILTPSVYNQANVGDSAVYLGRSWVVTGKIPEQIN